MTPTQFRRIRRQLDMTQEELGQAIGYKSRRIRDFEHGAYPIPLCVEYALYWLRSMNDE